MPAEDFTFGNGATIAVKDDLDAFISIAGVEDIPEVSSAPEMLELSDIDALEEDYAESPVFKAKDFIIEAKRNSVDPGQVLLSSSCAAKEKRDVKITRADGKTSTFKVQFTHVDEGGSSKGQIDKVMFNGKQLTKSVIV